jgi:antitoxin component YwqK of YwqJK toxin-antitoxin module
MKITLRSWRWSLPVCAALALTTSPLAAQRPLPKVELAEPVPDEPGPVSVSISDLDNAAPADGSPVESDDAPKNIASVDIAPADITPLAAAPDSAGEDSPPAPIQSNALAAVNGVELVKERFPSGNVRIEREMSQDAEGNYIPHGVWRQYDEKGRLIVEGRYDHNRRVGLWRRFYRASEAPLMATDPYKDFTGPFISEATFDNGLLQGKWTIVDAKQRKASEIEFTDGERNGKAIWYYPNGKMMSQASYTNGRVNGDVVNWAPNGSVVDQESYENGRKLGTTVEYHPDKSKKSEVTYLYAPLAIKTPDDWASCTLAKFESQGEDEKHGPFRAWHPNGQVAKQGEFRYNRPVGKFLYWYPNSQKQMEGTYADGKPEGVWPGTTSTAQRRSRDSTATARPSATGCGGRITAKSLSGPTCRRSGPTNSSPRYPSAKIAPPASSPTLPN